MGAEHQLVLLATLGMSQAQSSGLAANIWTFLYSPGSKDIEFNVFCASGNKGTTARVLYQPMKTQNSASSSPQAAKALQLQGQWCIVRYDNKLYPGEISDADDEGVLVITLHPIGDNKFVKPPSPDEIWYLYENVIMYIEEPTKASGRSRFVSLESDVWNTDTDTDTEYFIIS